MDARRHSFSISASRDLYLAILSLWALFMTSLLAWPELLSPLFSALKWITLGAIGLFFGAMLWRLRRWHWRFGLNVLGEVEEGERRSELVWGLVTPLLCVMKLKSPAGKYRLGFVFADMLSEADYRSLCRLIIAINSRA